MTDSPDRSQPAIVPGRGLWSGRLLSFHAIPSTNTWAVAHSAELGHGDVVQAAAQTAGRGRLTRSWLTVPGAGIACSVLLRKPAFVPVAPNVGQAAALAVSDLLLDYGLAPGLKWPNDVLVAGRKIAGILAELVPEDDALVLGIGLNVCTPAPDLATAGLADTATSMAAEASRPLAPDAVFGALMLRVQQRLDALVASGCEVILRDWTRRDALAGLRIEVLIPDADWPAATADWRRTGGWR